MNISIFMNILQFRILKKVPFISRFRFWYGKCESIHSHHMINFIGQNLVKTHRCVRDHPYITLAKGLGDWSQKNDILLTFRNIYADVGWVGGWIRKSPKTCWRNIGMVSKVWKMRHIAHKKLLYNYLLLVPPSIFSRYARLTRDEVRGM